MISSKIKYQIKKDFLTDDLVVQDESASESQRKYLGVCRLPEENSLVNEIFSEIRIFH